jgi:hypothetical protein
LKKFVEANPLSDPETAARKLIEIANGVEAVQEAASTLRRSTALFSSKSKERQLNTSPG